MIRRQLPVRSPVPPRSVLAGARSLVRGGTEARAELENLLGARFGASRVVLTDSGTSALRLALRALDTVTSSGPTPVALPAYSCYDVATAAVGAGVRPLFYDLDPSNLSPDLGSLRRALDRGARTVVVAHLYGVPVEWEAVRDLTSGRGAALVEDAAQGWGGRWRDRPLGGLGDLSVLSFGRGKGLTGGSGGALLVRSAFLEEAVAEVTAGIDRGPRGAADFLRSCAQGALGRPWLYGLPASLPWLHLGETRYRDPRPVRGQSAYSAGAVARTMTRGAEREVEARRRTGRRLRESLSGSAGLRAVAVPGGGVSGELRLPVLAEPGARPLLASREARKLGVMPGYPRPLPELEPAWSEDVGADAHPGAGRLVDALFTLPCHGGVTARDVRQLESLLQEAGALGERARSSDEATERARDPDRGREAAGSRRLGA